MKTEIEDKIKALLQKAGDSGATPEEGASAFAMAQRLMAKHGLTEEQIRAKTGDDDYRWAKRFGTRTKSGATAFHPVETYLGADIAKYIGVKFLYLEGGTKAGFFGLNSDVDHAVMLRDVLMAQFDREWDHYKRFVREDKQVKNIREKRRAFSQTYAATVGERLRHWATGTDTPQDGETQDLALVKIDNVANKLHELGFHIKTTMRQSKTANDDEAAGAGMMAGNRTSMSDQLDTGPRQLSFKK